MLQQILELEGIGVLLMVTLFTLAVTRLIKGIFEEDDKTNKIN
jgi:hypothetical protein